MEYSSLNKSYIVWNTMFLTWRVNCAHDHAIVAQEMFMVVGGELLRLKPFLRSYKQLMVAGE